MRLFSLIQPQLNPCLESEHLVHPIAYPMAHSSVHPVEHPWLHKCSMVAVWLCHPPAHPWTVMGFSRPFSRGTTPNVCLVRIKAYGTSGCSESPQVLHPSSLSSCSAFSHGIASHLMKLNPLRKCLDKVSHTAAHDVQCSSCLLQTEQSGCKPGQHSSLSAAWKQK